MNNISVVGRLTKDPTEFTNGCRFSVAVDNWGKDAGATFFDVKAFGKTSEFVVKYLGKGRLVAVTGRMESRKDDDGKTWWNLNANDVKGLDKAQGSESSHQKDMDDYE